MKTLIIDNFDSFTYNLYQYVAELGGNPEVYRNNGITLDEIARRGYTHIIISPGPGSPDKKKDFGICADVIQMLSPSMPILGVCLGHQGIIHYMGGRVVRAPKPVHGKRSEIRMKSNGAKMQGCDTPNIFAGVPKTIEAMRYHSLIGERKSMPAKLIVTAETTKDNLVMAVQHVHYPLYGVQFHPESIGTPEGKKILKNFLSLCHRERATGERGDLKRAKGLTAKEAENLLIRMASGKMREEEMADILKKMAERGETVDEIIGMARGMRKLSVKVAADGDLMDTCGTGGSGLPRMNISTTAAFVLAACGVKIAKHGNRAASGRCGSFDLLEKLGVRIELGPDIVAEAMEKVGIGFIFAPLFHPAMKNIAPVRKKLGIRTIFNLLGPLTNPAGEQYHLLGTTSRKNAEKLVEAMKGLGYRRATVVVGNNGLDDVTLTGKTRIYELSNDRVRRYDFSPEDAGLARVKDFKEIAGGSTEENAALFIKLLQGKGPTALQNLLLLNAGFGLYTRGISKDVKSGIALARKTLAAGKAYKKFMKYKDFVLSPPQTDFFSFHNAVAGKDKISVIAEIKRRSPSHGHFPVHNVAKLIEAYEKAGASAISVVTEPSLFAGSIELLKEVRKHTRLPVIRKDFITKIAQIDESAAAGANAVLLIARSLKKSALEKLVSHAHTLKLDTVVEVYDEVDIEKICDLKGIIIGINNRDLRTFETDVCHALELLKKIDPARTIIAESAFKDAGELKMYNGKIDAALIGTTLLTSADPYKKLCQFTSCV